MKKYIYKLTLENGTTFDYTIDNGVTFNHKDEEGNESSFMVISMVFDKEVEVEDAQQVIEAEVEEQATTE